MSVSNLERALSHFRNTLHSKGLEVSLDAEEYLKGFILEEEKENNPPENLDINGPASCIKGEECNYDLYADDPENNQIYFSVYWGDYSFPEFYKANQNGEATTSHIWEDEGKYTISVYAVDEYAYPSLQITKDITVTKNRPVKYNRLLDLFEKIVFQNKNYFHLLKRG